MGDWIWVLLIPAIAIGYGVEEILVAHAKVIRAKARMMEARATKLSAEARTIDYRNPSQF